MCGLWAQCQAKLQDSLILVSKLHNTVNQGEKLKYLYKHTSPAKHALSQLCHNHKFVLVTFGSGHVESEGSK